MNIAVLASTNGTDLQAIIDSIKSGELTGVKLKIVGSNKSDCFALQRAKEQGFKTLFVDSKGKSREEFDKEMAKALEEEKIDLIVLVGFMRILSKWFVEKFSNQIINVHPALLPKFGGKGFFGSNVHQAVLDAGEKETGMTIHFIDEDCDTGAIICQKSVEVTAEDNAESLKTKVQELEKKWYPWVIQQFADGKIILKNGKVRIG